MKKIYSNPKMVIVTINTHQMLASSPVPQSLSKDATQISSESEIGARGGWFDEDEE